MSIRSNNILLAVFSSLLLSASWYWGLTVFIFFAFVPLLIAEDNISSLNPSRRKLKIFGLSYLTFLIWNLLVTWFIYCVQFGKEGAIMAYLANALFMSIVFLIYSNLKKRINKPWAVWVFIPVWIAWEHFHTFWDLTWIWLTIGNVFAFKHQWIQWYEITGTSGGSLWALSVNVMIFMIIKNNQAQKLFSKPVLKIALSIIVPILISYAIMLLREPLKQTDKKCNTLVVQPNIDPYNDKFSSDFQLQFFKTLKLINGKIDQETEYLVLPETFVVEDIDESSIKDSEPVRWFQDSLIRKYPKLKIVLGASTYYFYKDPNEVTVTARRFRTGEYYDMFNSAIQIDSAGIQIYHKSKLVPAVERMPFPALLKPLEKLALDLGGTTGSLGTQEERMSFSGNEGVYGVAPVICYESVFADFVTEYIRKGATFIFIITNDGWWDDTPGYYQHLNYARLRAIENRRQIARSANTGTSCFIDEFGNISQPTAWWQEAVIRQNMIPNSELTFFSRFGDLLSYSALVVTIMLFFFALFLRFKK